MTAAEHDDDRDDLDGEVVAEEWDDEDPDEPAEPRRRWWQRRAPVEEDGPGAEVVPISLAKPRLVAVPDPVPLSKARAAVARVADRPFPTVHQVRVVTVWWLVRLSRIVPRLPIMLVKELHPISLGLWRAGSAWSRFAANTKQHEYVKEGEGNTKAKLGSSAVRQSTARVWGSVALLALFGFAEWWLWTNDWWSGLGSTLLIVAAFDAVGRRNMDPAPFLPPAALPTVLTGNVPLGQITRSIIGAFDREGFEEGSVGVAMPLAWDPTRQEYRISLSVQDGLKPEHVRAVERAIGARDHSIRNLATATATVRQLVIRVGDPLASVDTPPWIPTGSVSITQALDLGESSGDLPFAVRFGGVHTAVVGKTGAGKSKGMLWSVIDRLSACRDVVLWGCDLQAGPAFPMWRGVFQRTAYTPEDAEQLLLAAVAEIDRRMAVLQRLAESDDDGDDADEWHVGLGPALTVVIDEFAVLSDYNGKAKPIDLMGLVERIIRTGRKVWVTLILATQKTGNSDFGSTVITSQIGVKILMACEEVDTVRLLSTTKRDGGWAPHHLQPGVEGDARDAGKCYLASPSHDLPDIYRSYMAMTTAEVKRRARQRIADGLPSLDGRRVVPEAVEAVEIPAVLAAVEAAFRAAGDPNRMPTADLLAWLRDAGVELDENRLAAELRPTGLRPADKRWSPAPKMNPVRGYLLADVQAAIRGSG